MVLNIKEVEHVAGLARLTLKPEEKKEMVARLSSILNYVDKLNELDTDKVEPLTHILPVNNVFREDKTEPGMDRELLMSSTDMKEDGQYKVPKIM